MTYKEQAMGYIENEVARVYARLDRLEGCENNPVYAQEIKTLRRELNSLYADMAELMAC